MQCNDFVKILSFRRGAVLQGMYWFQLDTFEQ